MTKQCSNMVRSFRFFLPAQHTHATCLSVEPASAMVMRPPRPFYWDMHRVFFLRYFPPLSQTKEPGSLVVTTNRDYDLGEISKLVRGAYIGIAMMVFLHGYMKCVSSSPYI